MSSKIPLILLFSVVGSGQGIAQSLPCQDSPFGIHGPYILDATTQFDNAFVTNSLVDIHAKWIRLVEPELSITAAEAISRNINTLVMTNQTLTGQTIAQYKDKVKYWEVLNEPDLTQVAPETYVSVLKDVYQKVKSACSDCKVVFGGLANGRNVSENSSGAAFLKSVLALGAAQYFDVFNFHFQGEAQDYLDLKNTISVYQDILTRNNADKPMWMTEMATYDGDPLPAGPQPDPPYQSEAVQAAGLVRRYVYGLRLGVKKMFWNLIVERHDFGGLPHTYFDHVGLVNNPANDGQSHKKLAYYTYKKMVEVLEGSDWNNIQTIQESGDVYIYKFTKNSNPLYVAWWDYFNDPTYTPGKKKQVFLIPTMSEQANTVFVTEAVPRFSAGAEVTDYATAFRQDTLGVTNGAVMLALGENPVFVEELTITSVGDGLGSVPEEFVLYQNYPNPFNPTTTIHFSIPQRSHVTLKVFDVLGREVATLVDGQLNPGEHSIQFDTKDLTSGVYFYRLSTGGFIESKKMLMIR